MYEVLDMTSSDAITIAVQVQNEHPMLLINNHNTKTSNLIYHIKEQLQKHT